MSYAAIHPNWEKPRANMVDGYSLEMTAKEIEGLKEAAPLIRPKTQIAVTFLPGEEMDQRVAAAVLVRELGFEPIAHLSARRIKSEAELDKYLRDIAARAGVKRVFIIAGDPPEPEGPFEDSLQIIETGLLEKHGIEIVGIGGHPEGHPNVSKADLWVWMERKLAAIRAHGMVPLVVTQFAFDDDAIVDWVARNARARDRRAGAARRPRPGRDQAPARLRQALRRRRLGHRDEEIRRFDHQPDRQRRARQAGRRARKGPDPGPRPRAAAFLSVRRAQGVGRMDQRLRRKALSLLPHRSWCARRIPDTSQRPPTGSGRTEVCNMAEIIDGRAVARKLDEETKAEVDAMVAAGMPRPGLAVVLVGNDPASEVYVGRKLKKSQEVGIRSFEHRLPAETTQEALLALIARLNADSEVHGILVQVPLPEHIDTGLVLRAIAPSKDVDGFHPVNVGRLSTGTGGIIPCTPLGVTKLLDTVFDDLTGLNVVVIGKSNIVGKPIAMLMLEREATVTVTHIETKELADVCRQADVIIAAAGAPELVKGYWVKPGAVIIDVGITRRKTPEGKTKLVGDVAFDEVQHARAITPVPGGVGPMTISCLLANTVQAARDQAEGKSGDGFAISFDDVPDRSMFTGDSAQD